MLYIVDCAPALLLDEIGCFPLLNSCVTDVTQDAHVIPYRVVGRDKKKKRNRGGTHLA